MIRLASKAALLVALALPQSQGVETGYGARYAKGQMERTAAIRHMSQPAGTCMIARLTPADLGHWFVVTGRRTGKTRRCLVVDYAHVRDRATIARKGIKAELRFEDAAVICGSVREPPSSCPIVLYGRTP
jgi:hypothetical protein